MCRLMRLLEKFNTKSLSESKAVIIFLCITVSYFLTMWLLAYRYEEVGSLPATHWSLTKAMFVPLLLFIAAIALCFKNFWGYFIGSVVGILIVYRNLVRTLIENSNALNEQILSAVALKNWLLLNIEARPFYLFEIVMSFVIIIYSLANLISLKWNINKSNNDLV